MVLVRQQVKADPGKIVVALGDGEATIKKLVKGPGYYVLKPDPLDAEQARDFHRYVNEAENFFKHADKDPDGLYTLNPEWSEALLADAARKYLQLTEEYPPYLNMFLRWFVVHHQNMFKKVPELARILEAAKPNTLPEDRRQFFVTFLPFATRFVGG